MYRDSIARIKEAWRGHDNLSALIHCVHARACISGLITEKHIHRMCIIGSDETLHRILCNFVTLAHAG